MRIGIMQPYFLPYIGYFQLIKNVDAFVIYDNIKYTKKGWINRNRYLLNGSDRTFSIPIKKDSDYKNISDRYLSVEYNRKKLLRSLLEAYQKSPNFSTGSTLLGDIIMNESNNLFDYIENSILCICEFLNIETKIYRSSDLDINHNLKGEEKVISICEFLSASQYVNPIGGLDLYKSETFAESGLNLSFMRPKLREYTQFENQFVPSLSVVDVIMFNQQEIVKSMLNDYELI